MLPCSFIRHLTQFICTVPVTLSRCLHLVTTGVRVVAKVDYVPTAGTLWELWQQRRAWPQKRTIINLVENIPFPLPYLTKWYEACLHLLVVVQLSRNFQNRLWWNVHVYESPQIKSIRISAKLFSKVYFNLALSPLCHQLQFFMWSWFYMSPHLVKPDLIA
jgi:hypothetical protein